jgi:hypothetical protein
MEKDGIVQHSNSSLKSPLYMVQNPDGTWCPFGNYRQLNLVTERDFNPLPNMLDFL